MCGLNYPGQIHLQHDLEFQLLSLEPITDPPTFTLTCVTTGGPPTNVVWKGNNTGINYQSNSNFRFSQTVTNFTNSTYNNTLTVTGIYPGQYSMTAWNRNTVLYTESLYPTSAISVTGKHLFFQWKVSIIKKAWICYVIDIVFACSCCPTHPTHCCARVLSHHCLSLLDCTSLRSQCDWVPNILPDRGG